MEVEIDSSPTYFESEGLSSRERFHRSLLADQMKDTFREKIMTVGDYIIHMLAMYIFTKEYEGLVVIYASQLAHHHCVDLCVYMMEMRLNSRVLFRS